MASELQREGMPYRVVSAASAVSAMSALEEPRQ